MLSEDVCLSLYSFFKPELVKSLTSDQRGSDSHVSSDVIELLAFFVYNFVKSKMLSYLLNDVQDTSRWSVLRMHIPGCGNI